jgi:hypothetical protein
MISSVWCPQEPQAFFIDGQLDSRSPHPGLHVLAKAAIVLDWSLPHAGSSIKDDAFCISNQLDEFYRPYF